MAEVYSYLNGAIHHYTSVSSTQDEIKTLLHDFSAQQDFLCVFADVQATGRGRHGRTWISPEGNLYMTLALRPVGERKYLGLYAYICGLALYDALAPHIGGAEIALKWPNDVMVEDKKLAGILMEFYTAPETGEDYLLIGMGVNIKSAPDERVCIHDIAPNCAVKPKDVMDVMLSAFDAWQTDYIESGAAHILKTWQARGWRLDEQVQAKLGQEVIKGQFSGFDEFGSLIILLDNGEKRRITAGQLYFGDEKMDS